jgi:hypothetical protein
MSRGQIVWILQDSVERLQIGDNGGPLRLEERREHHFFAKSHWILIDPEARTVSGDLEEYVTRFTEIETPEVVAIDFAAVANTI